MFSHLLFVLNAGGVWTHQGQFPAWTMPGDAGLGCEGACREHGHTTRVVTLLMWSLRLQPPGGTQDELQGSQPEPGREVGAAGSFIPARTMQCILILAWFCWKVPPSGSRRAQSLPLSASTPSQMGVQAEKSRGPLSPTSLSSQGGFGLD